jgi:hypothetical protein
MAKFLEFLQASSAPAAAVIIFFAYRLLRLSLEASVRQRVDSRARKGNFKLACAYVAVLLLAAVCVALLIQPLLQARAPRADSTFERADRAAPQDRLLKL